jgi:hypothetical protein
MRALALMLLGLALLLVRIHFLSAQSLAVLGPWLSAVALFFQFAGYQQVLAATEGSHLVKGLQWSQAGWILLGISLPGIWAAQGALNFLVLQGVLLFPLERLLVSRQWLKPGLLLLAFLGLVGCIPFFSFSAYFQTFIPLMAGEDGVRTMQQKLFSLNGLIASVTMLSVVYQTGALGYFYWAHVFGRAGQSGWSAPSLWLAASLVVGLVLGLEHAWYSQALHGLLLFLGHP